MAIRSWPGHGRSGTSLGREVPVAVRDAVAGGAATERQGFGGRRAASPVGPRCGPVMSRLRPRGRSIIKSPSRAEPSRAEPSRCRAEPFSSRAEPSRAEPSRVRAEPSRAEPSRPWAHGGASSRPDAPPAPARPRHSDAPRSSELTPGLSPRLATGQRRQPSRRACIRREAAAWLLALAALPVAPVPASAQTVGAAPRSLSRRCSKLLMPRLDRRVSLCRYRHTRLTR